MENKNQNDGAFEPVAAGVHHLKILFVNAYFVETPERGANSWVLIDTGIPLSGGRIKSHAEKLFGGAARPSAIILTHGHFDHAGAVKSLADEWNVPVYAHRLEMPYLTGKSDYAPQDPTVGGALAMMSRAFPHGGIDLGNRVREIADDGLIPEMSGWQVVHTPGHTAGHISLFRESDRTLLAGDALATMNQDSWISNLTEKREFCKPPAPFTVDWQAARRSVETLAELEPATVAAGHGRPIFGAETAARLRAFAVSFRPPEQGRYVNAPAVADESGIVALPPPVPDPFLRAAVGAGVLVAAGIGAAAIVRRRKRIR